MDKMPVVGKTALAEEMKAAGIVRSRSEGEHMLDYVFNLIACKVLSGNKVRVHGFGAFSLRHRNARKARNPRTGDVVEVEANSVIGFKPSKGSKQ